MPARPEFGETAGKIRRAKVLREPKTHHAGQPDGDIRIAGEVAVDLEGVEHYANKQVQRTRKFRCGEHLIHERRQRVGNGYFFEKAPQYPSQTGDPCAAHSNVFSSLICGSRS